MKKRILIIDNDADIVDGIRNILGKKPYEVLYHVDFDDIIKLVQDLAPNIIFLDYNLNGKNGGDLCKFLKSHVLTKNIPVILFSAYPKILYSHNNFGFNDILEKPFENDDFVYLIDKYLKEK